MNDDRHRLLKRQLLRHFPEGVPAGLDAFLTDVDRAYKESDSDRKMLERSLDLTSEELLQRLNDRKRAEEARAAAEESLRQAAKMEAVGVLAGGVAHDFNNLLTPIVMCAEMAQEHSSEADVKELMSDVLSAAGTAKELTMQLLAFGRKQVLELRTVDLNEEVRNTCRMLARIVPEYVRVQLQLSPQTCSVRCDTAQLQQVVLNLGINARDAMPKGGTLTFKTVREHDCVLLSVTDTGNGMTKEVQAKIFEPFFTTKDKGRGTGLGLAMVHGIVEQHGGRISVASKSGEGTRFDVRLPLMQKGAAVQSRGRATSATGRGETVLVIEDDALVLRAVTRSLHEGGYRVVTARGGEEALLRCGEQSIDLVLSDVVMPGMDGRSLLNHFAPQKPVVMMSGHAQDVIGDALVETGGVRFIRKPFTAEALVAVVQEALSSWTSNPSAPL